PLRARPARRAGTPARRCAPRIRTRPAAPAGTRGGEAPPGRPRRPAMMHRAIRRLVTQLARSVFVAWWVATSLVWLLAAVPFTRVEVLQAELVPGLPDFIRKGFALAILAWLCWLLTIADDLKEQPKNAARVAAILLAGALVESLLLRFPGPAGAPAWAAVIAALLPPPAPVCAGRPGRAP